MIEINDLTVGYGNRTVLFSANAKIKSGKLTAILGKNGSGKTTLLSAIAGIISPKGGDVIIDRVDITKYSRIDLAKKLAYLPQTRPIPAMNVRKLIECARFPYTGIAHKLSERDREAVEKAITLTGTQKFVDRPLQELSGGERQIVFFAMALAQETDIILLDEPTTYLDIGQSFELMKIISVASSNGKTIVAVMHDIAEALKYSDEVLIVDGGKIIFSGTPQDAVASGTVTEVFSVKAVMHNEGYLLSPID